MEFPVLYPGHHIIHHSSWRGQVIEVVEDDTYRTLHFGSRLRQSCMLLADPSYLVLSYSHYMMAGLLFHGQPRAILLVGLGGGSLVKFLLRHLPHCRVEAVEHSEQVVRVARAFFHLPRDPRLVIRVADGGIFLMENARGPLLDFILVDAFDGRGMADSVYADAFFHACRKRLSPLGVLTVNLWRGEPSVLAAALSGIQRHFPGGILRLPVPNTSNEVVLAFPSRVVHRDREALMERARRLEKRMDLDFPAFVAALQSQNDSFLSTLMGWVGLKEKG